MFWGLQSSQSDFSTLYRVENIYLPRMYIFMIGGENMCRAGEEITLAEGTLPPSSSGRVTPESHRLRNASPQEPGETGTSGTPTEQRATSKRRLPSFPYILVFLEKDQVLREVLFNKFLDDFLFDSGIQDVGDQTRIT